MTLPANVEVALTHGDWTQYRLKSNGMTILVVPDHTAPVFTFEVVYHVGSRNEAPGNTGSAHLLEHLLFNRSTENYGKARGHRSIQEALFEAGADFSSSNMTTWYDRMTGYSTLPADQLRSTPPKLETLIETLGWPANACSPALQARKPSVSRGLGDPGCCSR